MKFIAVTLFAIIGLTLAENQDRITKMLHTISESDPNGFKYSYALPNGIEAQATGETKQVGDKIVFVQRGHYQHTAPNGITYIVSYVADETGFHPTLYEYNPAKEIGNYGPKKDPTKQITSTSIQKFIS